MGVDKDISRSLASSSSFSIASTTLGKDGWTRLAPSITKAVSSSSTGRIKGYTFAFTGGSLVDPSDSSYPWEKQFFPFLKKYGGFYVDEPSQVNTADCIVDCTSYYGSMRAVTKKRLAAKELQKLVISPRAFWKIVGAEYPLRRLKPTPIEWEFTNYISPRSA